MTSWASAVSYVEEMGLELWPRVPVLPPISKGPDGPLTPPPQIQNQPSSISPTNEKERLCIRPLTYAKVSFDACFSAAHRLQPLRAL